MRGGILHYSIGQLKIDGKGGKEKGDDVQQKAPG